MVPPGQHMELSPGHPRPLGVRPLPPCLHGTLSPWPSLSLTFCLPVLLSPCLSVFLSSYFLCFLSSTACPVSLFSDSLFFLSSCPHFFQCSFTVCLACYSLVFLSTNIWVLLSSCCPKFLLRWITKRIRRPCNVFSFSFLYVMDGQGCTERPTSGEKGRLCHLFPKCFMAFPYEGLIFNTS